MNNWTVSGRLGKDAEEKQLQGGKVVNLSLAVDKRVKNQSGEWEKSTQWVDVSWFNANDGALQYMKKGAVVIVEGQPSVRAYLKDGAAVGVLEMKANRVEIVAFAKTEDQPKQAGAPSGYDYQPNNNPPFQ